MGEEQIGLEDLGQRPKENSNEESEEILLGLYTTTGCATWGLRMYSRAGQVMSSMTSLWSGTYQKVLATD